MFQNGFVPAEVDIGGCDVVQALVVVVVDEGFNLRFEIGGQEVVFEQNAVHQSLMPAFDLALGLRMIRRTTRMLHAFVLQPFC